MDNIASLDATGKGYRQLHPVVKKQQRGGGPYSKALRQWFVLLAEHFYKLDVFAIKCGQTFKFGSHCLAWRAFGRLKIENHFAPGKNLLVEFR